MSGFEPNSIYTGKCVLPFILTGNTKEHSSIKVIRNTKFIAKVEESATYKELMTTKYGYLEEVQPSAIINLLGQIINNEYTLVSYEDQDSLGRDIDYNEDILSDEVTAFIAHI